MLPHHQLNKELLSHKVQTHVMSATRNRRGPTAISWISKGYQLPDAKKLPESSRVPSSKHRENALPHIKTTRSYLQQSEKQRLYTDPRTFRVHASPATLMAMALSTHGGFDDDFFGLPLAAMLTGTMRNSDGNVGNRGIALDVKEVGIDGFPISDTVIKEGRASLIRCIADYRAP